MKDKQLAEWAQLARRGNDEAFEQLYAATISQVYRTLYVLCGSERDAEDLAQNVYLELYRSLGNYDASRSLMGWLYGILMNQFKAFRRRRWRDSRKERKAQQEQHSVPDGVVEMPNAHFMGDPVMEVLLKLPADLKQVLTLRYVNDLPQQEIAVILGIPLGTVKSRLNRALIYMRRTLREEWAVEQQ